MARPLGARAAAALRRRLAGLAGARERGLAVLAAAVVLAALGSAVLLAGAGQVAETREIRLEDVRPDEGLAAQDTDGDGLSDLEEIVAGTNPRALDTDQDGLQDHWEVRHARLDPLGGSFCPDPLASDAGRDCDADGLTNLEEMEAGTEPNIADADRDGIPDGLEARCGSDPFKPDAGLDPDLDGLTNLEEMRLGTRCDRADSDLDGLEDPEELNVTRTDPARLSTSGSGIADGWLASFRLPLDDAGAGFQDPDLDGLTNREEYQFTARLARELEAREAPTLQGKDLLAFFARGLDPFNADTDSDEMSDGYEVRFGLDPLDDGALDPERGPLGDPDGDGLPNLREAQVGSNPFLADSDGDGLSDREEVEGGWVVRVKGEAPRNVTSDPSRADSDGDGLSDLEEREGRATRGGKEHAFPPLDPRSPDTDVDGLSDLEEVLLPIEASTEPRRVDPTDPDTDADGFLDGEEHRYWQARASGSGAGFEDLIDRLARQMAEALEREVGRDAALQALGPGGDLDGDGKPNLLDRDSDEDGLDDGKEVAPEDKPVAEGARSRRPLPATDPALVDSDGEGLPDAWENRFAVYDFALGDWNLNASSRDSLRLGDGKTDADRDLDEDGVDHTGPGYARPATYAHTNLFEFLAGTDPNDPDSDGDGLADGWEHYFTCVTAAAPRKGCGSLAPLPPGEPRLPVELDPAHPDADRDGTRDPDEVYATVPYVRFVRGDASLPRGVLRAANEERFGDCANQGPQDLACDIFPGQGIVRIHGEHGLNYSEAFAKRLDPSLGDTDGDAMPDAWEAAHGLAPADPSDGSGDADGDGLRNAEEALLGTDPRLADTDLGQLGDREDPNPLYPPDDAPEGDTDCDGVRNRDETARGTALAEPDTDRDGLLDGPSLAFFATSPVRDAQGRTTLLPASEALATEGCALSEQELRERLVALGIAQVRSGAEGERALFLGENAFATDPGNEDTDGDGAPDGWEAYWVQLYGIAGAQDPANPDGAADLDGDGLPKLAEYTLGMPPGWAARDCGPWWFGSDPRSADTDLDDLHDGALLDGRQAGADLDLDNDGLDDFSGEDPVPLLDPTNARGGVLATCASAARHADAWVFRGERARSKDLDRDGNGVKDRLDYARTRLENLTLDLDPERAQAPDLRGSTLLKGARFLVRGRLVVAEPTASGGAPVEGAVVLVNLVRSPQEGRSGAPERVLGLALTGPDGRFEVSAAVARERNATLDRGAVVFGVAEAAGVHVAWEPSTANFPPDSGYRVLASTLGRSEGPDGPYGFLASVESGGKAATREVRGVRGASSTVGPLITLRTTSHLELPEGLNATAGRSLEAEGRILDGVGDPLPQALYARGLRAEWLGARHAAGSRELALTEAGFALALPVPATTAVGAHALRVAYDGVSGLVAPGSAESTVQVKYPTNITARVLNPGLVAVAGERFAAEGEVEDFRGRALEPRAGENLTVAVGLAGARFEAPVGAGGRFRVEATVPASASVGTKLVEVAFLGSRDYEPSRSEAGFVTLVQKTVLQLQGGRSPLGRDLVIAGRLADLAGSAVDDPTEERNATVRVSTPVLQGVAGVAGTEFRFTVPRDALPGAGPILVRASFAGSRLYQGSSDAREWLLTSRTTLSLEPGALVRGEEGRIGGRLVDERALGLAGERVEVRVGNASGVAATNASGHFAHAVRLPPDHPTGGLLVEARFPGGRSGLLEAAEPARALVQVLAGTRLALEPRTAALGPVPVAGTLRDDRGEGVAGARLEVRLGNATLGSALTDLQGRFEAELPLPPGTPPGLHEVRVRFPGTGTLAPAEASAAYRLLAPTTLEVLGAEPLVRGQVSTVRAALRAADGQPLPGRTLELLVEGTSVGVAATDARGVALLQGQPPPFLAPGNASVAVRFPGDDAFLAAEARLALPLAARTELAVEVPAQVERGELFRGVLVLRDDAGRPLAGQRLVVEFSGYDVPVTLTTNQEGRAGFAGRIEEPGLGRLTVRYPGDGGLAPAERSVAIQSRVPILAGPGVLGLAALALALALGASLAMARRLRRAQVAEAEAILREAEERLFAGTEHQASILWAYARFLEHLRDHGFLVKESFTARELLEALARALPVGRPPLEQLVDVFEETRYSPHPIGPKHRDRAQEALRHIERDLREAARRGLLRRREEPSHG